MPYTLYDVRRGLATLAVLLILPACGGGGTEPEPGPVYSLADITGTWISSGDCSINRYRYVFDAPTAASEFTVTGRVWMSERNGAGACTEHTASTAVTGGVTPSGTFKIFYSPAGPPINDRLVYTSHLTSPTTTARGELRYENQPQGHTILGGEFSLAKP